MKAKILVILLFLFAGPGYSQEKISPALQEEIQKAQSTGTTVEAMIWLNDQYNTDALDQQLTRQNATAHERGVAVVTSLMEYAQRTQGYLLAYLESRINADVIRYNAFWITNVIFIEAKPEFIFELAQQSDVGMLEPNERFEMVRPVAGQPAPKMPGHAEPGLQAINAHKMWQLGYTGKGVILGSLDTGVEGLHPALGRNWHGNFVPASESWHDPSNGTLFPTDIDGHGTHTMGIMAGLDTVTADTIGIAYRSHWICARLITFTTSEIVNNFQWMLNPDGNPLTTDDMPAVINNSWYAGNPYCDPPYISAVINLENAGVAVIFAAGNFGPGPTTVTTPARCNYDALRIFSVGAVDGNYEDLPIAPWSSRGPTNCTLGGDQIKPEVSAPGMCVRSSYIPVGSYMYLGGTSMAAPHVCGAIALLKQAFPTKSGTALKQMLYETARDLGEPGEDNTYGMGIIDVYQAYIENIAQENPRPPDDVIAYSDYLTPSTVALSWSDPAKLVNGQPLVNFEISIFRDNAPVAVIAPDVKSFIDTGLTDRQQYVYQVQAHDLNTGNLSIERTVTVFAGGSPIPASPGNMSGAWNGLMQKIVLTWTDPVTQSDGTPIDDLAMIYIYRDQELLDSVAPGIQTYNDGAQLYEQTFSYTLVAGDNETPVNRSQPSDETEVFAGTRPDVLVYYGSASGPVLDYVDSVYRALRFLNIPVHKTSDLAEFGLPLNYEAVFVITGMIIPYDHQLNSTDGSRLLAYLNGRGSIYVEGNMCFNSGPVMAGTYNIRPWLGLNLGSWTFDPVNELSGMNQLAGLNFQYPGLGLVWDILNPSTSTKIWKDPVSGNIFGVYNEYNTGKIIGVVQPYGGLADTAIPGNKPYLMCRYLQMLGINLLCYSVNVEENDVPIGISMTCFPNPFSKSTTLDYSLGASSRITATLLDMKGISLKTLFEGMQSAGNHRLVIDGEHLPDGIYICRLMSGTKVFMKKLVRVSME
ncbi:MAG: S8 family serine peptidase [Bacteroidales bacterium]|nr:S8 family serine peptidase [Bacteroidales bacterium]